MRTRRSSPALRPGGAAAASPPCARRVPRRRRRARGARELRPRRGLVGPDLAAAHRADVLRGARTSSSRWSACSTASGATVPGVSAPQAVPGDKQSLRVTPSTPLADGTYTVNWRAVSAVDGHVESGAFAFGVGQGRPGSAVVVELLHTSPWARRSPSPDAGCCTAALVAAHRRRVHQPVRVRRQAAGRRRDRAAGRRRGRRRRRSACWSGRRRCSSARPASCRCSSRGRASYCSRSASPCVFCIGAVVARRPLAGALEPLGARGDRAPPPSWSTSLAGHAASPSSVWLLNVVAAVGAHDRRRRLGGRAVLAAARAARPRPRAARRGRRRVHAHRDGDPRRRAGHRARAGAGRGRAP